MNAGEAANRGALDWTNRGRSGIDRMRSWSTGDDQSTCLYSRRYNGRDAIWRGASGPSDQDSKDAIKCVL